MLFSKIPPLLIAIFASFIVHFAVIIEVEFPQKMGFVFPNKQNGIEISLKQNSGNKNNKYITKETVTKETSSKILTSKQASSWEISTQSAIKSTSTTEEDSKKEDEKENKSTDKNIAASSGNAVQNTIISNESITRFRLALVPALQRLKNYPALARERNWEGRVDLIVKFSTHLPPQIAIIQSTTRDILDKDALNNLQRAINQTKLPEELKDKTFQMPFTIEYRLEENL